MGMGIVVAAIAAVLLYVIFIYNGLVRARQMVREAWSGIDVQLKRRADLIPNLVNTVKGYAAHEKETLERVTELRTRAAAIDKANVEERASVETMLSQAVGRLLAVAESYPDLKADQNFRELQTALQEVEAEIQMARRYYNGATRDLNVRVESFPSNLVAGPFGFSQAEYFEVEAIADRAVPEVSFGPSP